MYRRVNQRPRPGPRARASPRPSPRHDEQQVEELHVRTLQEELERALGELEELQNGVCARCRTNEDRAASLRTDNIDLREENCLLKEDKERLEQENRELRAQLKARASSPRSPISPTPL